MNKKDYLDILNAGLATGADFAELYFEDSKGKGISLINGKIETATTNETYGVGVRLLRGVKSVYGYASNLSKTNLLTLISSLAAAFNDTRAATVEELTLRKNSCQITKKVPFAKINEKVALLKAASEAAKNESPLIVRVDASINENNKVFTIYNSNGEIIKDERTYIRAFVIAMASKDGKLEQGYAGPGSLKGLSFLEEKDFVNLAKEAARLAVLNLDAKECPSGVMPVVIGNAFGGLLFHEACGHPLEASSVSKGHSVFTGKLGERIASEVVSAVDDATIADEWGSYNVDDTGMAGERTQLIENGILTNYLIDDLNGRRMNQKANGSTRRQNFKYEPTSRMSNTYIDKGHSSVSEVIGATKLGLYAKSLGGGSVNPATGDFNFSCSEAYIIRDGKIAELVKGATLVGNGAKILLDIDMVANDLELSQGMCGAASGSIPVCVGQPTLRVKQMTVGGRGGELK
ncbi:MAG: TldD/PmbA family protein [Erysipelotrichaceae bacterium]|jgi:TldD protein|nr:TldD/PmbA family protein [Erysipelotrichaceae bacterium]